METKMGSVGSKSREIQFSDSDLARVKECGAAIEISRLQVASTFQIGTMAFPSGRDQ